MAKKKAAKRKPTTKSKIKATVEKLWSQITSIDETKELKACREAVQKLTEERRYLDEDYTNKTSELRFSVENLNSRAIRAEREVNDLRKKLHSAQKEIDRYKYLEEFILVLQKVKVPLMEKQEPNQIA